MKRNYISVRLTVLPMTAAVALLALGSILSAHAQTVSKFDLDRGRIMLNTIKDDIRKNYYDPAFRGMDLDARFKTAEEKIKQAESVGQVFGIIAQVLIDLKDSHTFFLPPQRASRVDYGWQMQMIGDKCYVIAIKPGSDAEAKGLKVGDRVLSVDGYPPLRENLWVLRYLYYTLRPQLGMRVIVEGVDGQQRQLDTMAKVRQGKMRMDLTGGNDLMELIRESENEDRLGRHRYYEVGEDLFIWKMPEFNLTEEGVDDLMGKAKKRKALILDLRGNPGGAEVTLLRLLGHLYDSDA